MTASASCGRSTMFGQDALAELRRVLLSEHEWRARDGLV